MRIKSVKVEPGPVGSDRVIVLTLSKKKNEGILVIVFWDTYEVRTSSYTRLLFTFHVDPIPSIRYTIVVVYKRVIYI